MKTKPIYALWVTNGEAYSDFQEDILAVSFSKEALEEYWEGLDKSPTVETYERQEPQATNLGKYYTVTYDYPWTIHKIIEIDFVEED